MDFRVWLECRNYQVCFSPTWRPSPFSPQNDLLSSSGKFRFVVLSVARERWKTWQSIANRGIDAAYMWRIVQGKRVVVSSEVLMLISMSMVWGRSRVEQGIEMANRLLETGGSKVLKGR